MIRTYRTRAKLSPNGHRELDRVFSLACRLYNAALEERIGAYRKAGVSRSFFDQCKELTAIRADDPEYAAIAVQAMRSPLRRLHKAFDAFFRRCKVGETPGFPRFKSWRRFRSIEIDDGAARMLKGDVLKIKGFPQIRLKASRTLPDVSKLKSLRIIRKPRRVEVHLAYELPDADLGGEIVNPVGIDVGVSSRMTLSDGTQFAPVLLDRRRLKRLQRSVSRKKRGSANRRKAVAMLAKEWQRVADRERQATHRLTAELVKAYDGFAVEDLKISNMTRSAKGTEDAPGTNVKQKSGLNRSILEQSWGSLATLLAEKAESAGLPVVRVDPRNTSQECSQCGVIVKKKLSERVHRCACGAVLDRDVNAALNILRRGFPDTRVGHDATASPAQTLTVDASHAVV